jgi:hypothetical protein
MERRDGGGNPSSVAGEMISAAADPVNRAARFMRRNSTALPRRARLPWPPTAWGELAGT